MVAAVQSTCAAASFRSPQESKHHSITTGASFQRKLESIAFSYMAPSFRRGNGLFRASLVIYRPKRRVDNVRSKTTNLPIPDQQNRHALCAKFAVHFGCRF